MSKVQLEKKSCGIFSNKNEFPTGSRLGNVGLRLEEAWCVVRLVAGSLISAAKSLEVRGRRLRYGRRDVKKGGVPLQLRLKIDRAGRPGCGVQCLMLMRARSLELRLAGAPNFNVVRRKKLCCWLVVDALLYNIVGREKQQVRGWEDVADVVHCWHVEASSRPQKAAAPASSLLRIPPRPLYFNVVCKF